MLLRYAFSRKRIIGEAGFFHGSFDSTTWRFEWIAMMRVVLKIEIKANRIDQLFPDLDPLPPWPSALDKDIDEYVIRLARTARKGQPIKILVILPEAESETKEALELPRDFACYFGSRADLFQSDLSQLFRDGRRFLAIGMSILVACLVLAQIAGTYLAEGPFRRLVEQSLPILGWVANWRPLEIFHYDWWP
jgi:hypothetical protein